MKKLIASLYMENEDDGIIETYEAILYLVNNSRLVVVVEDAGTSGGRYSTTWRRDSYVDSVSSVQEFYERYVWPYKKEAKIC